MIYSQKLDFLKLRHGVDSLYVTYTGFFREGVDAELQEKKNAAASDNADIRAQSVLTIDGHNFEVKPYGGRHYAYLLSDGDYSISITRGTSGNVPFANVQISSKLLSSVGVKKAVDNLSKILWKLGELDLPVNPRITRVDLFCDFQSWFDSRSDRKAVLDEDSVISRGKQKAIYVGSSNQRTGLAVGQGSDISFRLYDKVAEIAANPSASYNIPIWSKTEAFRPLDSVWRAEFQLRSSVLRSMSIHNIDSLILNLRALWRHLTTQWLRFVVQQSSDTHRDRWPEYDFWTSIISAFDSEPEGPLLLRNTKKKTTVDITHPRGLSGLISYMAFKGFNSLSEALPHYIYAVRNRINSRALSHEHAKPFEQWLFEKFEAKARAFSSLSVIDLSPDDTFLLYR